MQLHMQEARWEAERWGLGQAAIEAQVQIKYVCPSQMPGPW